MTEDIKDLLSSVTSKFLFPTIKERTVEIEKESTQKDVQTIVKEIIKADGSKEIITTIVDKSKENKESVKTVTISKSDWHASIAALTPNVKDIYYQVHVERRVLGDIYVGGLINTNKQFGISVGMEF